jgi:hypothetical protein
MKSIWIVAALVSYLWLCAAWFDHDLPLGIVAGAPAYLPGTILTASMAALLFLHRARLVPSPDSRIALALGLVAVLSRLPFVFEAYGLFSSDAAAQGVMALHIVEGKHHPVFLYNWSYIGSAKAILTAAVTLLIGDPVYAFALAAALVYGGLAASVYLLSRTITDPAESVAASLYVIFSPGFLTAWGMGNEGNYPDVLALGTLSLVLAFRFLKNETESRWLPFWMGVLGGVAFWIHILATYYLIALAGILIWHRFGKETPKRLGAFALGFALGDFPGILWNLRHDFQSFRWWGIDAPSGEPASERLVRAATQLASVFDTSFAVLAGYWPKESPPLFFHVGLLLLFPATFTVFAVRHREKLRALLRGRLSPEAAALGFAVLVVLIFAQSRFGWMAEEPRYLLFLYSVLPMFVASALFSLARLSPYTRLFALAMALALLLVSFRGGILHYSQARESDALNREFLRNLDALGIRHVHSDYHLSYKYVFLSHGRMVWTSALGPSQTEWYLPFRDAVRSAPDFALVPRSFRLAQRLEKRLEARGIGYRRESLLFPVLF